MPALGGTLAATLGFAWAHRRRPQRPPRPRGALQIGGAVLVGLLLLYPLWAGVDKVVQGVRQLVTFNTGLWGGDIHAFLGLNEFVGTDLGVAGMLAVLLVAAVAAARLLPRREALALLALLALCALFAVRLRLADRGPYMDFKHLGYVGATVLALAAGGLAAAAVSGRRALAAGAVVLGAAWTAVAVGNVRDEVESTPEQVTADMLRLRDWAAQLPDDASIRIDIPPSGNQLWAQHMLAEQPLGTPFPLVNTTYARMPFSTSADYVLHPRFVPGGETEPYPQPRHSSGPPVFESYSFILRPLRMPGGEFSDRTSTTMIQP